ncbi:MAG: gluconokinase [Acidobacteria bacterium]|nr:gluconokinase [Acidobacteriota bacterium]MBW4043362.1 gluconokinase [Acidobacteriota bacterium]
MIVILMGVTGTGKTTIANELIAATGWKLAEGDDYHSEANRAKMKAAIPLNDADRAPWLETLHQVLLGWQQQGESGVLTCSALKQTYRDTLSSGLASGSYQFVVLEAPKALIAERLAKRHHEYMNPALLDSQLATLENPKDALHVSVEGTPVEIAQKILDELKVTAIHPLQ